MPLILPNESPDFIPYGAPNKSSIVNTAPIQIQENVQYLKGVSESLKSATDALLGNAPIYSATIVYNTGDVVDDGNGNLYKSLVDNNTGNTLTDVNLWEALTVTAGGASLPNGGTTGQVLVKASDADQDVTWKNIVSSSTGNNVTIDTTSLKMEIQATTVNQTVFTFPQTVPVGSEIFVEGILLPTSEYTILGTDVTINSGTIVNETVTVLYEGNITNNTIYEEVTATTDGQTTFIFTNTPTTSMKVYSEGLLLNQNDYTISGNNIVLNTGVNTGARITLVSMDDTVVIETVTAVTDSQNVFNFSSDFSTQANVYIDGILKPTDSYTISGNTVTLLAAVNTGSIVTVEEGGITVTTIASGVFVEYLDLAGSETTVTLPNSRIYTPGSAGLIVSLNGIELRLGIDYIEDSSTTITLNIAVSNWDYLTFRKVF